MSVNPIKQFLTYTFDRSNKLLRAVQQHEPYSHGRSAAHPDPNETFEVICAALGESRDDPKTLQRFLQLQDAFEALQSAAQGGDKHSTDWADVYQAYNHSWNRLREWVDEGPGAR